MVAEIRRAGPAVGTQGDCEGCGRSYTRSRRGQWWCSPRCYRLLSDWAYGAVFNPTHRQAPAWDGEIRMESR